MRGFWMGVLLAAFLMPGRAAANDFVCPKPVDDQEKNKSEGRRFFQMGDTYFNMKDYESAAASFACVIQLVPYSVMARFRLAQSHDAMDRHEEALKHYRFVLADRSPDTEALRVQVQKRVEEIEAKLALEKQNSSHSPAPPPEKETPKPKEEKPSIVEPPVKRAPPSLVSRWWFWTGAGAVLLFAGATGYMGMRTLDLRDRWESGWDENDRDKLKTSRTLTDVMLAGTLITGLVWGMAVWRHQVEVKTSVREASWRVSPACAQAACGLTLTIEF